ncbi:MAG: hypothetical protein GY757_19125 [bacterium]|nr:hypothetical protein [bacterium]
MKTTYIAYDGYLMEFEMFGSLKEASEWLVNPEHYDPTEGWQESYVDGSFIAKITHETSYKITDKKSNYHEHTDDCPEDCGEEEWPYDDEYEVVGDIFLKPLKEDKGGD